MAWSETMLIIQHFYNVFSIDERLTSVEYQAPIVSPSISGLPQLDDGTTVQDLTPGTLWFIEDDNTPSTISSVSILQDDHTFAEAIPFSVQMDNISLEDDIQAIITNMGETASNYHDIIKLLLEILQIVPVKYGGTGLTSVPKGALLMGDTNNALTTVSIDNTPTQNSSKPVSSGGVYDSLNSLTELLTWDEY